MELNDYIAKLPIEKIRKIKILDNRITFPVEVDSSEFYKNFMDQIKVEDFTAEKAIFVASLVERQPYISVYQLLNSKKKLLK